MLDEASRVFHQYEIQIWYIISSEQLSCIIFLLPQLQIGELYRYFQLVKKSTESFLKVC